MLPHHWVLAFLIVIHGNPSVQMNTLLASFGGQYVFGSPNECFLEGQRDSDTVASLLDKEKGEARKLEFGPSCIETAGN